MELISSNFAPDLFEATDYRSYLEEAIHARWGWGAKSKLARGLGCESTFVSRVLNLKAHFTLHQILEIAGTLKLPDPEKSFLVFLFEKSRASSAEVKNYFQQEMEKILKSRKQISERLDPLSKPSETGSSVYYSAWYYSAIHMLLLIPEYRTPERIGLRLNLDITIVHQVLEDLRLARLCEKKGLQYLPLSKRLHLGPGSHFLTTHHQNWLFKAGQKNQQSKSEELRYAGPMSISTKAAAEIQKILLEALAKTEKPIADAKDEELWALSLHFFEV